MIENPNVICNECGFCKQNKILEQQLAIAVEALEKYSDLNNWIEVCDGKCTFESISGTEDHLAQDVLQKIKELEK